MSSSDLSELSSPLSTDEEIDAPISRSTLDFYLKGKNGTSAISSSPPARKKRSPSPPHEYVLADNPDIAFICMFRSRFSDAFPKSLPHYGPQDIENGVLEPIAGEQVDRLLCAVLGLVLNRKKDIECVPLNVYYTWQSRCLPIQILAERKANQLCGADRKGHYTRALEEAIQMNAPQWPLAWQGKNPLHGGGNFTKMTPEERLTLLKAVILWSLGSSEAIQAIMKDSYKQQRQDDDLNQPLSVQPWGRDGDKRRFWLVEGQDDTHFRLYRESNPALRHTTWRSVAGTIDEVKDVAEKLGEENSLLSRRLRDRILAAIPRFEASEDKRRRRDYRLARKAQFTRPDPGFSLYEGRTRGKRMKYTYSDEEDVGSDALSARRSNRQSGVSTPGEPNGPRFTASGRQVRSRHGGPYGESMLGGGMDSEEKLSNGALDGAVEDETGPTSHGRPQRGAQNSRVKSKIESGKHHGEDDSLDSMDEESDVTSSGGEWEGGDDEEPDDPMEDDDDDDDIEMSNGNEADEEDLRQSLVISLRYKKSDSSPPTKSVPGDRGLSKNISIPSAMSSDPGMIRPPHIAHVTTNQTEPNVGENSDDQWQDTQNAGPRVPAYDAASQNTPSEPKHVPSQEAATRGHTVGHTTESLPQHEPIIERIAKT